MKPPEANKAPPSKDPTITPIIRSLLDKKLLGCCMLASCVTDEFGELDEIIWNLELVQKLLEYTIQNCLNSIHKVNLQLQDYSL